jgi:hypothetical protein
MVTPLCRERRLIVLAVIFWGWAAGAASAQTPDQRPMTTPSLAVVKARVPIGDVVYVTDATGNTIKGKLAALTDDTVKVKARAEVRSVSTAEVRRIQWQQPDSPLTGVLIGAAIGAIPGIYWLVVDPNECNGMCPEEYKLIAIGAIVGGLIDRAITRRVTLYAAGAASGRAKSVMISPFVMRERKGVQVAIKF